MTKPVIERYQPMQIDAVDYKEMLADNAASTSIGPHNAIFQVNY